MEVEFICFRRKHEPTGPDRQSTGTSLSGALNLFLVMSGNQCRPSKRLVPMTAGPRPFAKFIGRDRGTRQFHCRILNENLKTTLPYLVAALVHLQPGPKFLMGSRPGRPASPVLPPIGTHNAKVFLQGNGIWWSRRFAYLFPRI